MDTQDIHARIQIYIYTCTPIDIHTYMHIHTYIYMCVCVCACIYTRKYIYIHRYIYIYTYVHKYICTYIYENIYICLERVQHMWYKQTYLSIYLSVFLSFYLSIYISSSKVPMFFPAEDSPLGAQLPITPQPQVLHGHATGRHLTCTWQAHAPWIFCWGTTLIMWATQCAISICWFICMHSYASYA